MPNEIQIVDYTEETKEYVKTLNIEWLQKYFTVEPIDVIQLSNPTEEIINKGGFIYYAKYQGAIVGTVSLLLMEDGEYELGKMAVTQSHQGLGIGKVLMDHCIAEAKNKGIKQLYLYSNKSLDSAIHIYRKYGFVEVPLGDLHYDRADIKMRHELH